MHVVIEDESYQKWLGTATTVTSEKEEEKKKMQSLPQTKKLLVESAK